MRGACADVAAGVQVCLRAANIRKAFALHKGVHADHESKRMSIFRSTSSGRSGAAVLMEGILSSSPRTRLPDERYTAFLIMPVALSNASVAAAAVAAVAAVPHSDCVRDESFCLGGSLPENAPDAATISIVAHAEAMEATAPAPPSGRAETSKAAVHTAVA